MLAFLAGIFHNLALFLAPVIAYLFFKINRTNADDATYSRAGIYYPVKYIFAKSAVEKMQAKAKPAIAEPCEKITSQTQSDSLLICGVSDQGDDVTVELTFHADRAAHLFLRMATRDGEVYQLTEDGCDSPLWHVKEYCWRAGGATVEILQPFERLRVAYVGEAYEKGRKAWEKIALNFIWNASSAPSHHPRDSNAGLLAEAIALEKWRDGDWLRHLGDAFGYEQYGVLHGIFKVDGVESREFSFSSWRRRRQHYGRSPLRRDFFVFGAADDGSLFNVSAICLRNGCTRLKSGSVRSKDGAVGAIRGSDVCLRHFGESGDVPKCFLINFQAKNQSVRCAVHVKNASKTRCRFKKADSSAWDLLSASADCELNLKMAKALVYSRREAPPSLEASMRLQSPAGGEENWGDYELLHEFDTPATFLEGEKGAIATALTKSTIFRAIKGVKIKGSNAVYELAKQTPSNNKWFGFKATDSARRLWKIKQTAEEVRKAIKMADLAALPYDQSEDLLSKVKKAAEIAAALFKHCAKIIDDAKCGEKEALAKALLQQFDLAAALEGSAADELTGKLKADRAIFHGKSGLIANLAIKIASDMSEAALQVERRVCEDVFAFVGEVALLCRKIGAGLVERNILTAADLVFHLTEGELRHLLANGGGGGDKRDGLAARAKRRLEIHQALMNFEM